MPTITTTVTSASASGSTQTVTTTEAHPEPLSHCSPCAAYASLLIEAPVAAVAEFMAFDNLVPNIAPQFFAGMEVDLSCTGTTVGSKRTITFTTGPLAGVTGCEVKVGEASNGGYSYSLDAGLSHPWPTPFFPFTVDKYIATINLIAMSDTSTLVSYTVTCTSDEVAQCQETLEATYAGILALCNAAIVGEKADPMLHSSGMYLRWDPTDQATAAAGEAAWTQVLKEHAATPSMNPETGEASQMVKMIAFDAKPQPWTAAATVVPHCGDNLTAAKLTNMLRGNGFLGADTNVKTLVMKPLAVQGVLSQTFRLLVTYDGTPKEGVPSTFIAKFLNPEEGFAFFRMVLGSEGLASFQLEDWCYATEFFGKNKVRQAACYFTSYDPKRENFCLILEDMNDAGVGGYTGGDQLSGGPGKDLPPSLPVFLETMEAIAIFNARFLNKNFCTDASWEGINLSDTQICTFDNPFFLEIWPVLSMSVAASAPDIFDAAGILAKDDPLWAPINSMLANQVDYYLAFTSIEKGGLYYTTISHGDVRSENLFFPKGGAGAPAFIDFQLLKHMAPEFDCFYFYTMSTPTEWRQANDLELMNVYYDTLIKESGVNGAEYTWNVFCLQMQYCVIFIMLAFVFLAPQIHESSLPGADQRKADVCAAMCKRLKSMIQDWGADKMGPGSAIDAAIARSKAVPQPKLSEWSQEATTLVPSKYLNGRDPTFYAKYKASQNSDEF